MGHTHTYTGNIVVRADAVLQQPIADLPREYARTLSLVVRDFVHHLGGGHARLRAADRSRSNAARFVVAAGWGGAGEREVVGLGLRFGLRRRALTVPGSCWRIRSTPAGCARCHRVERRSGPARRSSGASSRAVVGHRRTRRPTGWHHCGLCSGETREKDIIKTNVGLKNGCGLGRGKDITVANGIDCLSKVND